MRQAQAGRISRVLLYAVVGAIAGSFLGTLFARYWGPLGHPYISVGANPVEPWTLNLNVVGIALGVWLRLNLGGIVGVLLAVGWFVRRS